MVKTCITLICDIIDILIDIDELPAYLMVVTHVIRYFDVFAGYTKYILHKAGK